MVIGCSKNEEYQEVSVAAGKTHEVSFFVDKRALMFDNVLIFILLHLMLLPLYLSGLERVA